MASEILLASGSVIRRKLLSNAGLSVKTAPARIDEDAIKSALMSEGVSPRDIADALAEVKAQKISTKHPDDIVLGCDQVLEFEGTLFSKANTKSDLIMQLKKFRGQPHRLYSAAVIFQQGKPLWRHIGRAELTIGPLSDSFIQDYVAENWDMVKSSVGGYHIESTGVRLFSRVSGDYFTILGLPLIEVLTYLTTIGVLSQ